MTKPEEENTAEDDKKKREEKLIFMQYREKLLKKLEGSSKKLNVPCKVIFTLRKLKTC